MTVLSRSLGIFNWSAQVTHHWAKNEEIPWLADKAANNVEATIDSDNLDLIEKFKQNLNQHLILFTL